MGTNLSLVHSPAPTAVPEEKEFEELAAEAVELNALLEALRHINCDMSVAVDMAQSATYGGTGFVQRKLPKLRAQMALARTLIASAHRRTLKRQLKK